MNTTSPLLARALLPLLEARQMLYRTYLKLDNEVKAIVRNDRVCQLAKGHRSAPRAFRCT